MKQAERDVARVRDLVWALVPTLLLTASALLVFLVRQVYGPGRSESIALIVVAGLPILGAILAGWTSWRQALDAVGLPGKGIALRLVRSALAFSFVSLIAWAGPWFVVRRLLDLASPFESMRWILMTGIVLQGLVFRAVLSRRYVPVWMGILYWIACAAIGIGLWNQVTGLFV